jgi:hypothetical protein
LGIKRFREEGVSSLETNIALQRGYIVILIPLGSSPGLYD